MKILIISYYFPPYNTIGAVRVGKMAKYLVRFGHDVRVIAAQLPDYLDAGLELEIPEKLVNYTPWLDISRCRFVSADTTFKEIASQQLKKHETSRVIELAKKVLRSFVHIPDRAIGWYPFAIKQANNLFKNWIPDVIYASTPPSSLLIAYKLSKRYKIPFVAELRDPWVGNAYVESMHFSLLGLRDLIQKNLEQKVLTFANSVIVVSEEIAEMLSSRYKIEPVIIYNGFDPDDYVCNDDSSNFQKSDDFFRIVYTGTLYGGKHDPTILFEAIKTLANEGLNVKLEIFGPDSKSVLSERLKDSELVNLVKIYPKVPRKEAIKKQKSADALLVLSWFSPYSKSVYTGKLFEYVGTGRPILVVGPKNSAAARFVTEKGIGEACETYDEVVSVLKKWILAKKSGVLISYDPLRFREYTREHQAKQLESVLITVAANNFKTCR